MVNVSEFVNNPRLAGLVADLRLPPLYPLSHFQNLQEVMPGGPTG